MLNKPSSNSTSGSVTSSKSNENGNGTSSLNSEGASAANSIIGGSGTFMIGNSSGNRMQYLADGSIYMKSTTFCLDATTILLDSSAADGTIR